MEKEMNMGIDPNGYTLTNVTINNDEELFFFAMFSGRQVRQFFASPKHAKRIMLLLKQKIEEYEDKYGELKTELQKGEKQETKSDIGFNSKTA